MNELNRSPVSTSSSNESEARESELFVFEIADLLNAQAERLAASFAGESDLIRCRIWQLFFESENGTGYFRG